MVRLKKTENILKIILIFIAKTISNVKRKTKTPINFLYNYDTYFLSKTN